MADSVTSVAADLQRLLPTGSVLSDFPSLTAYAIDAGIYRIRPRAVVRISSEADLRAVLDYARPRGIPLTARAGGSNLTGNAIGSGIILEFSGFNRVIELNPEEKWARVQPGLVYAELNRGLARRGLLFAPDPSSGEVCKIGGMLGNNSAGPHSLKYGATKDNVLDLRLITADGRDLDARPLRLDQPDFASRLEAHEGLRDLFELLKANKEIIQQRRIRVSKNSSGYNLFDPADGLDRGILDIPKVFIGSEGTLGFFTEARLKLIDRPPRTAAVQVYFRSIEDAGRAVVEFLPLRPGAMELMDASSLDLIGRPAYDIPPDAAAMLLVEFDEEPIDEAVHSVRRITRKLGLSRPIGVADSRDAGGSDRQEALWKVRKAIYPTLYRFDARKKPINFVDDVVVPASRLPELIAYLEGFFRNQNIPVAIYGHIGDGNAHINPLMDLNDPDDFGRLAEISREIHSAVIQRFGGSICGEHGDGRVRGEFLRELYGEDLYALFERVKQGFDPGGILNPGVKLTSVPFTAHIDTERLAKPCATCGKCNAVCPVYDITQEESNGARGWFHILTSPDYSYAAASRVVEACINCKSCLEVCPAGIDVSRIVLEKRAERPNRAAGWFFALEDRPRLLEAALGLAGLLQPLWDQRPVRRLLDRLTRPLLKAIGPAARLSAEVALPRLSVRTLRRRHSDLTEENGTRGTTAYFHGCAAQYFNDGVGDAVISLLRRKGDRVILPRQRCSGTPIETYGHRERVVENARFNIRSLQGYPAVITGCASCTFMLKDYARFFDDPQAKAEARELAGRVKHITEYLAGSGLPPPEVVRREGTEPERTVTYHSSCHLRAAGVHREPRDLLRGMKGYRFVEMRDSDRCAGGAGTFLVKDFAQSREIFERKRRAVEESGAEVVATGCPACMIQLRSGLKETVVVKHVAQLLDECLSAEEGPTGPRPDRPTG